MDVDSRRVGERKPARKHNTKIYREGEENSDSGAGANAGAATGADADAGTGFEGLGGDSWHKKNLSVPIRIEEQIIKPDANSLKQDSENIAKRINRKFLNQEASVAKDEDFRLLPEQEKDLEEEQEIEEQNENEENEKEDKVEMRDTPKLPLIKIASDQNPNKNFGPVIQKIEVNRTEDTNKPASKFKDHTSLNIPKKKNGPKSFGDTERSLGDRSRRENLEIPASNNELTRNTSRSRNKSEINNQLTPRGGKVETKVQLPTKRMVADQPRKSSF